MRDFFQTKKFFYSIIIFFVVIFLWVGGAFWYRKYQVYKAEKQVKVINQIIDAKQENRDVCKTILDFDKTLIQKNNSFFREKLYDNFREKCDIKYNIARAKLDIDFCSNIIKKRKSDFSDTYILLDSFWEIQKQCTLKYLTVKFSTGSFFDVENDFKTSINLDFSLPFYEDIKNVESEEFLKNRIQAKKRLIGLLDISRSASSAAIQPVPADVIAWR